MTVTESVMALPSGSASGRSDSPRASARARVKGSVTHGDRVRPQGETRAAVSPRRFAARPVVWARTTSRVMYLDGADGFLVNGRSQTIREVATTNYAAASPLRDWRPYRVWCRTWQYTAAVPSASALDSLKFLLVHPVRGPLTVAAAALGAVIANH